MKDELYLKTVLVTGGGKGIGRETARLFGINGYNVAISGRDQEALFHTGSELKREGIEIFAVKGDVTSISDCENVVTETIDKFGRIDVLVNNAGMSMRGMFENTDLSIFHKILDINFRGAVNMTKQALPHLKETGGSVIFISSIAGLKGLPGVAPYSASKMALKSFSESLRCELWNKVHVGIVYVAFTENDTSKVMYDKDGNLVPFKKRKNNSTQKDVAKTVFKVAVKRKRQVVMTPTGKTANLLYILFPALSEKLIARFSENSKLYATDVL